MQKNTPFIINKEQILQTYLDDEDKTSESYYDDSEGESSGEDIAILRSVFENYSFDESSFVGIPGENTVLEDNKTLTRPLNKKTTEENNEDNDNDEEPLKAAFKDVLIRHNVYSEASLLLNDLIDVVRKNTTYFDQPVDPILKEIDTSTPLSYWKRECPALFDYPENMHGYKTSWEFLKGIYNPNKHKKLYYNDLKEINPKLYRAVYRRNSKEKFLPNHSDRVAEEIKIMKQQNIKLSDIKNPKLKEKFRMRFYEENKNTSS